ncbi:membrane protease subunit, stomatin/prohibitin [Beggiatoa alba B18LD]|uniref:Protein HflC n=1 Tax=Beggiatoa alba B18LD TaxID=395493 RepID=I3CDS2_9GAMM|nr:protease modulator HflC [Beggiatoa alba]EIJ41765.1 membrane protease subunit, stomatin/prohibitin [Beggiatoa alba B18LD]
MLQNKMILGAISIVVLLILMMSMFYVQETEKALKLQFGRVVKSDYTPGLHFKVPFLQTIRKFDARIQSFDSNPQHFLTGEQKNLIVDSFIKWRITDTETYFKSVGGNPINAGRRLSEFIADGLRSEFGKRTIQEVVSGDRAKIMDIITAEANRRGNEFGIEVVDVRIKQINLPDDVSTSVYQRMDAAREQVARELRSRGEAAATRIRAEADRENMEIISKAERDAEQIRGEGDATATEIYANAFSRNPDFYSFTRSLTAYRETFKSKDDILLLEPDSDFFKFFKGIETAPAH